MNRTPCWSLQHAVADSENIPKNTAIGFTVLKRRPAHHHTVPATTWFHLCGPRPTKGYKSTDTVIADLKALSQASSMQYPRALVFPSLSFSHRSAHSPCPSSELASCHWRVSHDHNLSHTEPACMDPVDPFFSKFLAVSPGQVWAPQSLSEVNLPVSRSALARARPHMRRSNVATSSKAGENGAYER